MANFFFKILVVSQYLCIIFFKSAVTEDDDFQTSYHKKDDYEVLSSDYYEEYELFGSKEVVSPDSYEYIDSLERDNYQDEHQHNIYKIMRMDLSKSKRKSRKRRGRGRGRKRLRDDSSEEDGSMGYWKLSDPPMQYD